MITSAVEPRPWPRRRRGAAIALVFCFQLGMILWLSERAPVRPRPRGVAPTLAFAGNHSDRLLALADPTLFALPHQQGFSEAVGLWTPSAQFHPFAWSEPIEWLAPSTHWLDAAFKPLVEPNGLGLLAAVLEPMPDLTLPEVAPLAASRERSIWRIEGELAQRRLLTSPTLRSWTTNEILANTVVQMAVDDDGRPVSAMLLSGCGAEDADSLALAQAQATRFNSVTGSGPGQAANPLAHLTWGNIIFEWHTLAATPPTAEDPPSLP
jgi:hypothetical protein